MAKTNTLTPVTTDRGWSSLFVLSWVLSLFSFFVRVWVCGGSFCSQSLPVLAMLRVVVLSPHPFFSPRCCRSHGGCNQDHHDAKSASSKASQAQHPEKFSLENRTIDITRSADGFVIHFAFQKDCCSDQCHNDVDDEMLESNTKSFRLRDVQVEPTIRMHFWLQCVGPK